MTRSLKYRYWPRIIGHRDPGHQSSTVCPAYVSPQPEALIIRTRRALVLAAFSCRHLRFQMFTRLSFSVPFTFVPALATVLSTSSETDAHGRIARKPAYSAHMVATIVVYVSCAVQIQQEMLKSQQFNPAKTAGSMLLATRYCAVLALLASIISLCSLSTVRLFDYLSPVQGSQRNWISEIGDWIVCILWIGGSMGSLAWAKVWVANPSFNSGTYPNRISPCDR